MIIDNNNFRRKDGGNDEAVKLHQSWSGNGALGEERKDFFFSIFSNLFPFVYIYIFYF